MQCPLDRVGSGRHSPGGSLSPSFGGLLANCHRSDKLALIRRLLADPVTALLPLPQDTAAMTAGLAVTPAALCSARLAGVGLLIRIGTLAPSRRQPSRVGLFMMAVSNPKLAALAASPGASLSLSLAVGSMNRHFQWIGFHFVTPLSNPAGVSPHFPHPGVACLGTRPVSPPLRTIPMPFAAIPRCALVHRAVSSIARATVLPAPAFTVSRDR